MLQRARLTTTYIRYASVLTTMTRHTLHSYYNIYARSNELRHADIRALHDISIPICAQRTRPHLVELTTQPCLRQGACDTHGSHEPLVQCDAQTHRKCPTRGGPICTPQQQVHSSRHSRHEGCTSRHRSFHFVRTTAVTRTQAGQQRRSTRERTGRLACVVVKRQMHLEVTVMR